MERNFLGPKISLLFAITRAHIEKMGMFGERGINDLVLLYIFVLLARARKGGAPDLTKTKSLAFKTLNRLFSWFFISETLLLMLGIALIVSGFRETYRFINPLTLFLIPGILSCFSTFYLTRKELEKEWNEQLGTV